MEENLTKTVLNKIKSIYPKVVEDMIVLFGSRAKGYSVNNSDIDIVIFTEKYNYYKEISIEKGYRNSDEDAGCEIRLENNLLLEIKVSKLKLPKLESNE